MNDKMTKAEGYTYCRYLQTLIDKIEAGEVEWAAFTAKFSGGARVAVHSKDAPKRPRGVA